MNTYPGRHDAAAKQRHFNQGTWARISLLQNLGMRIPARGPNSFARDDEQLRECSFVCTARSAINGPESSPTCMNPETQQGA